MSSLFLKESLPLCTPGLSRASDLADVFQRICHIGARKGTQFQVFWRGTRALIRNGILHHAEHLKVLLEAARGGSSNHICRGQQLYLQSRDGPSQRLLQG